MGSLFLMTLITLNPEITTEVHPNKPHILGCTAQWPISNLGMIVLFDLTMSIFSMTAFIIPLRKVMKGIAADGGLMNLMRIGQKYAILTSCACITTIWLMAMIGASGFTFASPLDILTNMICLMLTTAYYDDTKYYKKICCCPIRCSNLCCSCCCGQHGAYLEGQKLDGMELQVVGSKTKGSGVTTVTSMSNSPGSTRSIDIDSTTDPTHQQTITPMPDSINIQASTSMSIDSNDQPMTPPTVSQ